MSTICIDKEHAKILDRLIAHLTLRGQKLSKKELFGKLIENAITVEGIANQNNLISLELDPAWKGLEETFNLGISELSEKVDELLYKLNGEN